MSWKELFRRLLIDLEDRFETAVGMDRAPERPIILPYTGFGTTESVWMRGRVIDDPGIGPAGERSTAFRNLRDNWIRFASREVAGAEVRITIGGTTAATVTDEEGYFDLEMDLRGRVAGDGWLSYEASLSSSGTDFQQPREGRILVPSSESRLGIISDIDDTVIETNAVDRLRMLRTVLLGNAHVRVPFEGIAPLLQELRGPGPVPVFYVSSGPWNLYDFLVEFFARHGLPAGPILLQDFGLDEEKLIHASHHEHKLQWIRRIIETYPRLEWILIGDSGQRDPEIYTEVATELPDRIRAIVIRDVTTLERDVEVRGLMSKLDPLPVDYALVETAQEARRFLAEREMIGIGGGTS